MNRQWLLAQWAELRWWKRYLKKREPAKYLLWKSEYWLRFLEICKLPSLSPGARVLDAGCGPAGIFMALSHYRVDAIDPLLAEYARLPHFRPDNYPWVRFYPVTLESFPGEETYDLVFCVNAINHMEDVTRSAGLLYACLKPGGVLVVSADVHKYRALRCLFRLLPLDVMHPFQEDHRGYRTLFSGAGFSELNGFRYKKGLIFDYWVWKLQKQT